MFKCKIPKEYYNWYIEKRKNLELRYGDYECPWCYSGTNKEYEL